MTMSESNQADLDRIRRTYARERAKRVRDDANTQFATAESHRTDFHKDYYADPALSRAPRVDDVDVVIIGGGMGGLLAGARLREAGFEKITVIEKGADFGGTWYWNRYPGAQCDVESYIYLPLLEELDYVPSEKYAHQPEIFEHLKSIGRHYGLYPLALFQTEALEMRWDDVRAEWRVTTDRADTITARFLVIATGDQHQPRLPAIPGIDSFGGKMFHTSRWDRDYAKDDLSGLKGKRVGVIGTGATGLQVVPGIADAVEDLFVFQRTPSSVSERGNRPTDPTWAASLRPGWQRRRVDNFTAFVTGADQAEDLVQDGWTRAVGSITQAMVSATGNPYVASESVDFEIMEGIRDRVERIVEDPVTAAALKPYYRFNCKRPGFHDGYLASFNRPNVTLVDTRGRGVQQIVPEGAIVDNQLYPLDCLIFATGFDVGSGFAHSHSFDIVGVDDVRLSDKWSEGYRTFHGMHSNGFPNCFFLGFTQTGISTNFAHTLMGQTEHLAGLLKAASASGAVVIEATKDAEDAWVDHIHGGLTADQLAFLRECTPSYFNNEGNPEDPRRLQAGRYPEGPMAFFELLRTWRETGDFVGLTVRSRSAVSADGGD